MGGCGDRRVAYGFGAEVAASSTSNLLKFPLWNKETKMESDVIEARVIEPGCFHVKFADGVEGRVRFAPSAYRGVFEKLRDPEEFSKLYVNGYFVTWPGELDLAPDAMHQHIKDCGEWLLQ